MTDQGIGERARAAIGDSGLTQREVCERIGIDETKLSKSLAARRRFTARELLDLATATGVTVHWLLSAGGEAAAVPGPESLPTRHSESADQARRRREIIEQAWWLFADRGYDGVRVGEIAAAADMSTAAVHYYFPTKRTIFIEVLRYSVKLAFDRQSAALGAIDDPDARLRELIRLQSPVGRRGRAEWSIWLQVWNSVATTGEPGTAHGDSYRRWWRTVSEIVAEGQRGGLFRAEPLDETVDALTGFIDGFGVRVLTGMATAEQMTAQVDRYIDRVLRTTSDAPAAPAPDHPRPSPAPTGD